MSDLETFNFSTIEKLQNLQTPEMNEYIQGETKLYFRVFLNQHVWSRKKNVFQIFLWPQTGNLVIGMAESSGIINQMK